MSKQDGPVKIQTQRAAQARCGLEVVAAPKATRKRAPTDLAEQYTEQAKKPRRKKPAATAKLARTRRSTEERARVQQLMDPSDDLMRRLARIGAIPTSLATDEPDDKSPLRPHSRGGKVLRRPRRWELSCGKCGHKSHYTSAAGGCPHCGTITVRL